MPFYDDWHRTPSEGLSERARDAWARHDWAVVAQEVVSAAVANADASRLADAVETDARTLELSFLDPYGAAIEGLPPSPVRDAALALLTVRDSVGDRGLRAAQAAVSALVHDEPRLAASVAIGIGMIIVDRGRWADVGWFAAAADDAIDELRASGVPDDAVEPLWFVAMTLAVLVEWHTFAGAELFDELAAALAVPRARNLLRGYHAPALVALGTVQSGRGEFGAAGVSMSRAANLLDESPAPRASTIAWLAFTRYRQGNWREARRATVWLNEIALDGPWARTLLSAVATLEPATRGDFAGARVAIDDAVAAAREHPMVFADVLVLHARIALAIGSNDWSGMIRVLEDAEEPGYRRQYTDHEWRALWGMALRNSGRSDRYAALIAEWEQAPGADDHPYYWAHVGLHAGDAARGEEALAAAIRARDAVTDREDPLGRTWVRIVAGTLISLFGDPTEGMGAYETARAELVELGADGFVRLCTSIIEGTAAALARASGDELSALTAQQRRVADLVAEGYTSAEIGQILYLSKKTIDFHVANIVSRLGLSSRRELKRRMSAVR